MGRLDEGGRRTIESGHCIGNQDHIVLEPNETCLGLPIGCVSFKRPTDWYQKVPIANQIIEILSLGELQFPKENCLRHQEKMDRSDGKLDHGFTGTDR